MCGLQCRHIRILRWVREPSSLHRLENSPRQTTSSSSKIRKSRNTKSTSSTKLMRRFLCCLCFLCSCVPLRSQLCSHAFEELIDNHPSCTADHSLAQAGDRSPCAYVSRIFECGVCVVRSELNGS